MRNKLKILVSCLLFVGLLSFLPMVNAATGDLDTTFSQDGKLYDFFVFGSQDYVYGTAIQTDGKIVAAGQSLFGGVSSCSISRYTIDGTLDPTFDGDGRAIVPSGRMLVCRAVAIQANGKIVAAGTIGDGSVDDFAVVRFNTDGSPDTSFDSDGMVTTALGSSADRGWGVAIQTDGKIVVVGSSFSDSFGANLALVRYNTDGSLDTSFDSDGMVITVLGGNFTSEILYAVAIQTDGGIVAAGTIGGPGSSDNFVLARYNTDGSLGGVVNTDVGNFSSDTAYAVAIQSDGKIVAAGMSVISTGFPPSAQTEFSLVRYNTDFSLDTSFDSDGKVVTSLLSTSEQANAIAIQTDGKIVIGGNRNINGSSYDFALARYNTDGSLDTSFDSDGMVFTDAALGNDAANGMAIQTDGKIVAAGYINYDFAVVRYNTNGSIDTSFSSDGITSNDVGFLQSSSRAVAIQSDSKFVVAGYTQNQGGNDFAVIRYNADGSPDTSFDLDGTVVTSVTTDDDDARAVAIQADGKIVVAGSNGFSTNSNFTLVRYNTDGSLDTSFDLDGKVITSVGNVDYVTAVAIQADGKIIAAGASETGANLDFTLVRYNADGSLDTSFDSDGKVVTTVVGSGNTDSASAVAIQADGKIVAAGVSQSGLNVHFTLVRYNPNGSLDTSFDSDGIVITPIWANDDIATAVAIQPDGKIVASGYTRTGGTINDFAVVRYNTNGSLDTSFDLDGKLTTSVLGGADQANSMTIQANGKILVAGYANNGTQNNDFALVRYNTDGSLDTSFSGDGKATFDFWGSGNDFLYGMALDSSGRAVVVGEASGNFAVARILGNAKSPFDYDGDGKADVSVYRPSNNYWYLSRSSDSQFSFHYFGAPDDIPTPADYDGDGKTDLAIFRPSSGDWWYQSSITGVFTGKHWGSNGDIPRPSDFDGDGRADYVVYHPANNYWYRLSSGTGQASEKYFGAAGDKPVIGDFDGDGKSDPAIFRPSSGTFWYLSSIDSVHRAIPWGTSTDLPVPADYDGDGKTDAAVYRPSTGCWYIYFSGTGSYSFTSFGISEDRPVPADYDGDGKADIAVYRPSNGTWYMLRSTAGFNAQQFGNSTDVPTPNAFVP